MSNAAVFDDVEVIEDFVLFQFEEYVDHANKGAFREVSDGGIILGSNYDQSAKKPRWGRVLAVGPKVKEEDVAVGDRILVEPLGWTKTSVYKDVEFARTEVKKILAKG